jgi:hypothetical protein
VAGWHGLKDDAGLMSRLGGKVDNAAAVNLSGLTGSLKYAQSGGQDAYAGAGGGQSAVFRLPAPS